MVSDALSLFDAQTARWFTETVGTPTMVQQEGWPAIAAGGHVLISAPTGTGKTLSAFLVFIDRLKAKARRGELAPELHLLYLSPLKSLGNDIRENLKRPLSGIEGPELSVAIRTGDTTAQERRQMIKNPPHILITTPESLYLLLTSKSGRSMLETARAVVVDELHALMNGKRGAHMLLSLARLDALCGKPLQRIGLSATVEPLDVAARYLGSPDPVAVIAPKMQKSATIEVNSPLPDMRVLPEGTIWPELARMVFDHCEGARTVIAFVEGRAQAEKLAHGVNLLGGKDFARTHHGCVSKEQRLEAETQLRSGKLRLLVATSSMELGIDVGEVDRVLQIGFPRTISSTLQRLGRAGHNPGRTSVMRMFPHTAAEGVLCGLTAKTALSGGIERSRPPRKCLDVLAQHLVSMAAETTYSVDDMMALLNRAYCFQDVTRDELEGVLRMLAGDFEHARDIPVRPRLLYDRLNGFVSGDAYSRMLSLSAGGTIPDRGLFSVRTAEGIKLGDLDEEYVFEARVGDKFLLGAFAWRIAELRRDTVVVTPATTDGAQSPFWKGDSVGRPYQTGVSFGKLLRGLSEAHAEGGLYDALRDLHLDDWAANNALDFLTRQINLTGCLPDDRTILIEHFQGPSGEHQMMVHSVFGGQVNAGFALLLKEAIHRLTGMDIQIYDDDDGLLLQPYGSNLEIPDGIFTRISPDTAKAVLSAMLTATPLFSMAFRYNAGRALMMGVRKGGRQPLWVQRLRGAQALDDVVAHAEHPLMIETRRECLEEYWDVPAIERVLRDVQTGAIAVRELHLREPSPMSLPLRRALIGTEMYDYNPMTSKVHQVAAQALAAQDMVPPESAQLERAAARARQPQDEAQLHALLMAEGDVLAGELDVPIDWMESLARKGRALFIEPGLWIAAEHLEAYRSSLEEARLDAQQMMLRRCLRYRGAQSVESLCDRYCLEETRTAELLLALLTEGVAVQDGTLYYHHEVYGRAQRATVMMRRKRIATQPPERYAALLSSRVRVSASAEEQLRRGLLSLVDMPFPPALFENTLLPARTSGYRPQMLDTLLTQGELVWQLTAGDKPQLSFHRLAETDWDAPDLAKDAALSLDEQKVADALRARGASFAGSLAGLLQGRSPVDALSSLAEKGLAHADSFSPVRQWLERSLSEPDSPKRLARARASASVTGRWELARPLVVPTMDQKLEQAFDRVVVLCRETAQGISWTDALSTLRIWEFTGRVCRGYFIKGLSGAQFVREAELAHVSLALSEPTEEIVWLNAQDPSQAWGKILSHDPERAFMCIPSTAVALHAGKVIAVFERNGQALRVFDADKLPEALQAFARDFRQRRIFAARSHVTVKQYPKEATSSLESAGFSRQMLDYELWQKRLGG